MVLHCTTAVKVQTLAQTACWTVGTELLLLLLLLQPVAAMVCGCCGKLPAFLGSEQTAVLFLWSSVLLIAAVHGSKSYQVACCFSFQTACCSHSMDSWFLKHWTACV
jgi:hypothetical protein